MGAQRLGLEILVHKEEGLKMYQVVRTIPASFIFKHGEFREVLSEHSHYVMAWLSCYLWHSSLFMPCHIEEDLC